MQIVDQSQMRATKNPRLLEQVEGLAKRNGKERTMRNTLLARPANGFSSNPGPRKPELQEGRYTVDPLIARRLLDQFNYANQRNVLALHVAKLAAEMRSGVWVPGSQLAFGVLPDKSVHLVNGQHRLNAIIESGITTEFQIVLCHVSNETELHALYYRFDTVQAKRSDNMVMRSVGFAESLNISASMVTAAYKASAILSNGLKVVPGSQIPPELGTPDGRLKALEGWWPFVKNYDELTKVARSTIRRRLLAAPLVAFGITTLRYQPVKADAFWRGVADDDGLRKNDPRKAFLHVLDTANFTNGLNNSLILASYCWNAWYEGRTLMWPKIVAGSICAPLGTPFAKRGK